ncbi:acetyl-CoA carboxylase biotin carboxyl carrier protein [Faecalibaculum rodentium]|uniref:acetyl-CoA carboxylase biotin carboxyl carrier protein n=3 Tax=Faecalibaculum rodentium TaxID=1702221 RepID=UPI0025A56067|nr:biotin/lipoyl-containing protein [Faecalibaculum rodentium]
MTDTEKLGEVIAMFEASGLQTMDLELEGLKVRLKKKQGPAFSADSASRPEDTDMGKEEDTDPALQTVKSPLVGIFYASRKEGGEPIVSVGDPVKQGQTLCLVEAMKTMNEIPSPCSGTVEKILAENGHMAEFDQPLFLIRENRHD